jgi:hypothetical protein
MTSRIAFFLFLMVAGAGCSSSAETPSSVFGNEPAAEEPSSTTAPSEKPAAPAKAPLPADSFAMVKHTYLIEASSSGEGFSATCDDGESFYNGCSAKPIAFHWQDRGEGDKTPKLVRVEIQSSIFCADPTIAPEEKQMQKLHLNASSSAIGSFEGDVAACSCTAVGAAHTFEIDPSALATYKSGGDNVISIEGPNRCLGLKKSAAWDGAVARVTVLY